MNDVEYFHDVLSRNTRHPQHPTPPQRNYIPTPIPLVQD